MDFGNWIIPLLLSVFFGGYVLGKNIELMCKFKKKHQRIIFWVILYTLVTCAIIFKTIWDAFIIYSLFFITVFALLIKITKLLKLTKIHKIIKLITYKGTTAFILSAIIVGYGVWNVNNPIVKNYDIKLSKHINSESKIVFITDLHLGTIKNDNLVDTIVNQANRENPDVFLIIGDLYDEFTKNDLIYESIEKLSKISTKFGIYYVEGNHDLLTSEIRDYFHKYNIYTLEDESVLINDNYYLVGRKDYRRITKNYEGRQDLDDLISNLNKNYPIILLDHQPILEESKNNQDISLQLSGHTHGGQLFPANLILLNGYYKKNNLDLIVSNGYGVWNSAVRTAGRSEMASVKIHN